MADFLFYLMACGAVLSALGVVALRSPIANVLALLGCFSCLATIYLVCGFPLLAAVQILVYAGAILVLFLFVIMLLNLTGATQLQRVDRTLLQRRRLPVILAVSAGALGLSLWAIGAHEVRELDGALAGRQLDTAGLLAEAMFSRFLLPFEATSVLLLATAVAVLVLAKRERGPGGAPPAGAAARAPVDAPADAPADPTPAPGDVPEGAAAFDPSEPRGLARPGALQRAGEAR